MISSITIRRLAAAAVIGAFLALGTGAAHAQDLDSELSSLEAQMSGALSNDSQAQSLVDKLDNAEKNFAQASSSPKANKAALQPAYERLESMLSRLHETYSKKKDDCIEQIDNGGQCDYTVPEQVALQAAYPLAWLRFQGASTIYTDQPAQAQKLLNAAIDDFTQSSLAMPDPNLVRENVLGRAYCERELGKYDKNEYQKAIEDFKQIMSEGSQTAQYKASQQGLATTCAAMGDTACAQKYGSNLGTGGGAEMFKLSTSYAAMYAQPAKKAEYLKEIVDLARSKENDKEGWSIAVSGIAKYSHNPAEELGSSGDPFEDHLLANVMLAKKDQSQAAKYFVAAARSGKYPKDYKFAADIYFNEHNMGEVNSLLADMARSNSPDAQWATYMRYKLPRGSWEQSGMKNAQAQTEWLAAADDYLKKYPHGEYSNEIRFRLGEHLQEQKDYVNASKIYQDVNGGEYGFAARFNAAECEYVALVAASSKDSKDKAAAAAANPTQLRNDSMTLLRATIKDAPEAERAAPTPGQKKYVRDTTGRAKYMLAGLIQSPNQTKQDAEDIASLLNNFEPQYPAMNEKFQDVFEWRLQALNTLGRYDDIQRELQAFLERNKGNSQNSDLIKTLGIDFWKQAQVLQASGDQKGYVQNAKLTETAYSYFEDMVSSGKMQPKNLTGTLSILGQAYMATGQEPKAETIFQEVVKADAASPDANAGLARIAQSKHDLKDAVTLWTTVESTAAESDNQWYEAKYNIAEIYSEQGNLQGACSKLAQTRAEHPGLGSPEMAAKWNALQTKLCLNRASN